jgi:hypothetical protein
MSAKRILVVLAAGFVACGRAVPAGPSVGANPARELVGLWEAKRYFGPDVRGSLLIKKQGDSWEAGIAGRRTAARVAGEAIAVEFSGDRGAFKGKRQGQVIVGHWIQPATTQGGTSYATPIPLVADGPDRWRGEVHPLDDVMTFYLMVSPRDDGSVGAFLINPERNAGKFIGAQELQRDGNSVRLLGKNTSGKAASVTAEDTYP